MTDDNYGFVIKFSNGYPPALAVSSMGGESGGRYAFTRKYCDLSGWYKAYKRKSAIIVDQKSKTHPSISPRGNEFARAHSTSAFAWVRLVIYALLGSLFWPAVTPCTWAQTYPITNALTATRHWSLALVIKEFEEDALRLHTVKIYDGRLWLFLRDTGQRSYHPHPPPRWIVRSLDLGTLETAATFSGNFDNDALLNTRIFDINHNNGSLFDVYGAHVYVVLGPNKLRKINVRNHEAKDFAVLLPNDSVINVTARSSGVFLGAGDRLLHVNNETGKLTILASQRRRSPDNALDNRAWGLFPKHLEGDDNSAKFLFSVIGAYSTGILDLKTMKWQLGEMKKNEGTLLAAGEHWPGGSDGDRYHIVSLSTDFTVKTLLNGMSEESAWWRLPPQFPVTRGDPGAMRGSLSTVSFDGRHLWLLFPPVSWKETGDQSMRKLENVVGRDATLWCYDDRWLLPVEIPLLLPPGLGRFDVFQRPLMFASRDGLVILVKQENESREHFTGFWFIPRADLEAWIDENVASQKLPARNSDPLYAKYDKDKNGMLDPEELEAYRKAPEYLAGERRKEALAFIAVYDRNKDGGIDKNELPDMHNYLFLKKGNGIGTLHPTDLFQIADKNKDRKLDVDEFCWLHEPEFDYQKLRKTPTLPPSLLRFDLNKNGKLEPDEAAAVKKSLQGGK